MSRDTTVAVDRVLCAGRGVCAELTEGVLHLDEWGYPVESTVRLERRDADALVRTCPVRALYRR